MRVVKEDDLMLQKQTMWVSGLTLGLLAGTVPVYSMAKGMAVAQTPAPATQQQVPDAPTPQTLPRLNTLTPVGPADNTLPPSSNVPASTLPATPPTAEQIAEDQEAGPPPAAHASDIQVRVTYVQVPFTVKDSKNRLVPGLTYRDVRIYENGLRQSLKLFSVDPAPLSVALVIDQSVTHDTMDKINASLSALQGAFTPYDELAVFTYNNGVTKQTDFTAAQSARLGVILERSKGKGNDPLMGTTGPLSQGIVKNNAPIDGALQQPGQVGNSLTLSTPKEYHTLNDAILAAAQVVAKAAKGRRRVVYVISDGKEYGSKATEKEVIRYLQTNQVSVYATLVGDSSIPGLGFLDRIHLPLTMRNDELPRITTATGGECDPEFRPRGIESSFAHLAEEVRTQYTLGYYTNESPFNEKFRKTEVRVMRPGLTVIAKEGYYPNASDSRAAPAAATTPTAPPPAPTAKP
jgi:VWFA-related protein